MVLVCGPRRVGKTTLVQHFVEGCGERVLMAAGDDAVVREFLESQSIDRIRDFVGQHTLVVIDEAQYARQVGRALKIIVDHLPHVKVIATGSSSMDLANDTGEPLTGRKHTVLLFPLAQLEIGATESAVSTRANLETRLVYGSYPEVVTMADNARREEYLVELTRAYLFRDILTLEGIRNADKLERLLQLLAFQIGGEVSISELGSQLGLSRNTAERYLDLLEKSYVVLRRRGFSRNLRKEITKSSRYYFVDTGIRNALIRNFNPLSLRDDTGALWENYVVMERAKRLAYLGPSTQSYFWRTHDRLELDIVESSGGTLCAWEVKWGADTVRAAVARQWQQAYPGAAMGTINRENYLGFVGGKAG